MAVARASPVAVLRDADLRSAPQDEAEMISHALSCHLWRRSSGHESIERRHLGIRKHKPELGATPQHVGGGSGEFLPHQIAHLSFRQRCTESYTEIGRGARAGQNALRALAISSRKPARMRWFKECIVLRELPGERGGLASAPSRQSPECRPAGAMPAEWRKKGREASKCSLGEASVGGDLAAEDRQQRRAPWRRIEFQHIVPRRGLSVTRMIIMERSHAGIAPHHIGGRKRSRKKFRSPCAEKSNFTPGRGELRRTAGKIQFGGAGP